MRETTVDEAASGGELSHWQYGPLLESTAERAKRWLDGVPDRPVPPHSGIEEAKNALGRSLPDNGHDAARVIEKLVAGVEPGLMAIQSPRFYGWVMGGTHPVALAADWLVSSWDQNAGMRSVTPGVVAAEEIAGEWVLEVLGLPAGCAVGFVTGATVASFVGLSAARHHVLANAGWDVNRDGLFGAPHINFVVGQERHSAVDLAGRYLGLGAPMVIPSDAQGRIRVDLLADHLADVDGPTIVCLQAGNVHSGSFDDFLGGIEIAHQRQAWAHIDGAFGLWAAASPRFDSLVDGFRRADSWATDAHKTLNVPYDCGVAIVAHPEALAAAFGVEASYLATAEDGANPYDLVPELSRRARGVPVWAALRWLGRSGVTKLVERLADGAAGLAEGFRTLPGAKVLNEVVFTQVCLALRDDATTIGVGQLLRDEGLVFASPSRWHDRAILRFSVSNWATDAQQVELTVDAVRRALAKWEG
ncbi:MULTISPECIES: pyridoxal-dependent decarboxylase [unclassified Diaminobutyricimonas]|uniref:pyridoxal phosphate-dependent decarboxylase family protein n=1 Tax=unclassified Diaminobutyricimonas TaxID=2643261 RepID=UPI0012F479FC|nr:MULTISPECIES: pyridoxal-dependent decarboxylase [unclassified Diaminobutyricimonas]